MTLPLRTLRRATPGAGWPPAAMGKAGPALVMAMAPPVTPCGDSPHPTVLDPWVATDHPAAGSGDVGGTDEVPVSAEGAERTAEGPPPGLGDPAPADRAGRGGPPLVHLDHLDARHLRLVLEGADEMGAPPVAQPKVLAPAGVPVADALGVAYPKGPHLMLDRPGDDGPGCLVVGLVDAPAMAGLLASLGPPQLAPAPRSFLSSARGLAPHVSGSGLGVGQVQVAFGPHGPPGDEQGLAARDGGEGVDDAGVNPGDDLRVNAVVLWFQGGGHIHVEPPRLAQQRHGADALLRVGKRSTEAHHERSGSPGHWQSQPVAVDAARPVVVAHRQQALLAAGGPRPLACLPPLGRLEPLLRVAPDHRAGSDAVE